MVESEGAASNSVGWMLSKEGGDQASSLVQRGDIDKSWKAFKHQSQTETSFVEGEDEVMKRVLNHKNGKLKKYQLMHPEMIEELENAIQDQIAEEVKKKLHLALEQKKNQAFINLNRTIKELNKEKSEIQARLSKYVAEVDEDKKEFHDMKSKFFDKYLSMDIKSQQKQDELKYWRQVVAAYEHRLNQPRTAENSSACDEVETISKDSGRLTVNAGAGVKCFWLIKSNKKTLNVQFSNVKNYGNSSIAVFVVNTSSAPLTDIIDNIYLDAPATTLRGYVPELSMQRNTSEILIHNDLDKELLHPSTFKVSWTSS
ncbi:hypothetical protein GUITHDRAFT_134670 [Guillardia theta CCMP2712]|uniref:Uncharacterized protein n=1 Tax=Guillardia theta (strain CCMP2712) TaxID=905079 RepID=L1JS72_GUITC|nr:hypothetical protein GUITHDRAFT_134670 [Guillardia theta CCMP2712]EKX51159.1 hypothetical protein GUITHDRAFT_134670 [Guillardia theta CCMP2712]|eukprot:XP_005838139.1 hypothetical protein GUITHDRAFT_134670 [Guillardia theta CCMP2712]